jgi:hypothetical protein
MPHGNQQKVTFNATPGSQPDGWSPLNTDSEGSDGIIATNPLQTDDALKSIPLKDVARKNILQSMDDQFNALISPGGTSTSGFMGSIQNLFQPSGASVSFGQLGDTKMLLPISFPTDNTRPRQDSLIAKGPGIIDPTRIKRRIPDPSSLIPEYGAPYVPITQDTNPGDTGQSLDNDPDLSSDTVGEN